MFCPQCGSAVANGTHFCGNCGAVLAAPGYAGEPEQRPQPSEYANSAPQTVSSPGRPPRGAAARASSDPRKQQVKALKLELKQLRIEMQQVNAQLSQIRTQYGQG